MGLLDYIKQAGGLLSDAYDSSVNRASGLMGDAANYKQSLAQMLDPKWHAEMRKPENMARFDKQAQGMGMDMALTFAGPMAKTADLAKLKIAEQMKARGVPDEKIHKATGWFFGMADGKPRFEIDDSRSLFNTSTINGKKTSQDLTHGFGDIDLGPTTNILEHPELSMSYGDSLSPSTFIKNRNDPLGGAMGAFENGKTTLFAPAKASDAHSTTLHELQHAIQQREGWARGGSPADFPTDQSTLDLVKRLGIDATGDVGKVKHDLYRRLAGEAEARLTQVRMNMTPEQRAASYPPSMFDVPVEQQIVRGLLK